MKQLYTQKHNRSWILLHYLSLIALIIFFYSGKFSQWPLLLTMILGISLVIFIISFVYAFIKTNLWKIVHTSSKNLDERETQVVLHALKYAYAIFTILCVVIMYVLAITQFQIIDVFFAGGVLLVAHTLPAAIVGWNEKCSTDQNE
jgi:membrane-associated HD superfamily phosphohydrolase